MSTMAVVYLVWSGEYSDKVLLAAFAKEEDANEYCSSLKKEGKKIRDETGSWINIDSMKVAEIEVEDRCPTPQEVRMILQEKYHIT